MRKQIQERLKYNGTRAEYHHIKINYLLISLNVCDISSDHQYDNIFKISKYFREILITNIYFIIRII